MTHRHHLGLLAILPTLVLAAWAVWVGASQQQQPALRMGVTGFDPRDLLRGHYVEFRLKLNGDTQAPCACINPSDDPASPPKATSMACGEMSHSNCPYPLRAPGRRFRYYLPQDDAQHAQEKLRQDNDVSSVVVRFDGKGEVSFEDFR